MKPKPPLRDLRGAAEAAARDYIRDHCHHDPYIETRLRASHDQGSWKIVALVDDPTRTADVQMKIGGLNIGMVSRGVFPLSYKDHEVIVVKRKR